MQETTIYHIYAKQPGAAKFRPVNITRNKTVIRVNKSTIITDHYLNIAKNYIKIMKLKRPALNFQIREQSKNTVIYKH